MLSEENAQLKEENTTYAKEIMRMKNDMAEILN